VFAGTLRILLVGAENGEVLELDVGISGTTLRQLVHQTCLAAIWKDGKLAALPTPGGNNAAGVVMNERGQTVGAAETTTRHSACMSPQVFRFLPVIWDAPAAKVQALSLPAGDTLGVAIGINDRGDAVGTTGTWVVGQFAPP
jgi:hypothetical protein